MKIVKKVLYVIVFVIVAFLVNSTISRAAATVTVTTETLNLREKASTSSKIVATLSEGVKCNFVEETGDWYKVTYKNYTGYVSKEYVKKNEDTVSKKDETATDNDVKKDETATDTKKDEQQISPNTGASASQVSTGKVSAKTDVKIVPLIYSSKIDELQKNTKVTIYSEMNGWAYIETNTVSGWIRSNMITDRKGNLAETSTQGNNNPTNGNTNPPTNNNNGNTPNTEKSNGQSVTEKVMYVKESAINVRKEPNTSSKIMMELAINTKLTVIGESGDWYQVKTSEGNGYVLKKLLSDKQVTTSRGGNSLEHTSATGTTQQSSQVTTSQTVKVTTSEAQTSSTTKTTSAIQTSKVSSTTSNKITTSSTTSNSKKGKEVVEYAKQFLGVKYVYGGASKSGFDCSGFTMYVYKKFGISMRHGAQAQAKLGKVIKYDQKSSTSIKQNLQAGDLVFFLDYETMDDIGHCGIYKGDGKFIHASSGSGYCVKINSLLPGEYYNTRFCATRRVL